MPSHQQDSMEQLEAVPAGPAELEPIASLLASVFGIGVPGELRSAALLQWKFFACRVDWPGPRSYVVRRQSEILGHCAVWPALFESGSGLLVCGHLVDWAASPASPGTGIALYEHLMRLPEAVFAIGGSKQARRLLPRLGFVPYGQVRTFVRVVRPWGQFVSRTANPRWRNLAYLVRNTAWSVRPCPAPEKSWVATAISSAGPLADFLASPARFTRFLAGSRRVESLDYLLACPAAQCRLFGLSGGDGVSGYFLLNHVGGQCRI